MAKRKSLGFNGGKGLVVYVGNSQLGRVNPKIIEMCRIAWNECSVNWLQKTKKTVKKINFEKRAQSSLWAGVWYDDVSTLKILDNGNSSPSYYKCVIIHEMAHAWYDKESRLSEEKILEFYNVASESEPITEYTRKYRAQWGNGLYANELHSAITEHLYTDRKATLGDGENLNRLIEAFNRLHAETS